MIYNFRMWLSKKLFQWGKAVHPEISELTKKIIEQQNELGRAFIFASDSPMKSRNTDSPGAS